MSRSTHLARSLRLAIPFAILCACAGGKDIEVGDPSVVGPVSFGGDVVPLFASNGCNNAGCHSGGTPAGALGLSGTPAAVFVELSSGGLQQTGGVREVDKASPAASLVLTVPLTGSGVAHVGGGKQYGSTNDGAYKTILHWIQQGALNN